jgi:hypothetical protein
MSLPRLWATLQCAPDATETAVDTAAPGEAAKIWRHAASTLKDCIPGEHSSLNDLLKWIQSAVTSGTDNVASQCLEFGVACLLVFEQANCTGPKPAVPESPFQPDQDALQVRLKGKCDSNCSVFICTSSIFLRCTCHTIQTASILATDSIVLQCSPGSFSQSFTCVPAPAAGAASVTCILEL